MSSFAGMGGMGAAAATTTATTAAAAASDPDVLRYTRDARDNDPILSSVRSCAPPAPARERPLTHPDEQALGIAGVRYYSAATAGQTATAGNANAGDRVPATAVWRAGTAKRQRATAAVLGTVTLERVPLALTSEAAARVRAACRAWSQRVVVNPLIRRPCWTSSRARTRRARGWPPSCAASPTRRCA